MHTDTTLLTAFIKYTALCKITDRAVWRKYLKSLRKLDITQDPKCFAYIVNYLAKAGVKDPKLWEGLQDESNKVLDAAKTNVSFDFTELFLNAFLNKSIKPELQTRLIQRIKKHIPFSTLEELQRLWMFTCRYNLSDEELFQFLRNWTIYKLKNKKEEEFPEKSISYIAYSISQTILTFPNLKILNFLKGKIILSKL